MHCWREMGRPRGRRSGLILACVWALGAVTLAPAQDGMPPALVVTETVVREPIHERLSLIGTAQPLRDSLVASEVEGRVTARSIEHGDRVEAGTVLVELDSTRLRKELDRVRAQQVDAQAQLELAEIQAGRARRLFEREILSRGEMDEAAAKLRSNQGRVGSIEAQLASIEHDLASAVIRAPFAGVVTELHTEIGEWIARGAPVVRLTDLSTVEIRVEVPERHFRRLVTDAPVPARVDALPGLTLSGKIFAGVPQADPEARTFPVFVRAPNPAEQVGSGMLVGVELTLSGGDEALLVSKDAVVRQAQQELIWVVEDGAVRAVSVRTGRGVGSRVEVHGDVAEGDVVVVRGNERLAPGQPVVEQGAGAAADSAGP